MYDYGRLVYLDNQKTGSTFVSHFLSECCTLKNRKSKKHFAVKNDYRPKAVYFSTVRHPVDLYLSLYQYGSEKRGGTFKNLRSIGRFDLYSNMSDWIEFVLDEKNAAVFRSGYDEVAHLGIGLMSYRAMRITLRHQLKADKVPAATGLAAVKSMIKGLVGAQQSKVKTNAVDMASAKSYDDLIGMWRQKNIAKYVFKQEELNASLLDFATKTVPQFFDQEKTRAFLAGSDRVNTSNYTRPLSIPAELYGRIIEKEKFLIEQYYPQTDRSTSAA